MPVRIGTPSSHFHRLIIPDDVLIKFDLLMISTWCSKRAERWNKRRNTWKSASSWLLGRIYSVLLITWSRTLLGQPHSEQKTVQRYSFWTCTSEMPSSNLNRDINWGFRGFSQSHQVISTTVPYIRSRPSVYIVQYHPARKLNGVKTDSVLK